MTGQQIPLSLRPMIGAVLAGGESRRFGRDKATTEIEGVPMVLRASRALAAVCDEVVIVSSRSVSESWGTVLRDLRPGFGPLAGIESALHHAFNNQAAAVFVLATDLPSVGPEVIEAVALGAVESDANRVLAAAASRRGDPDFEPLCSVYRTECVDIVTGLLDKGERAARSLFEAVDGKKVVLNSGSARAVSVNVNLPADLDRAF